MSSSASQRVNAGHRRCPRFNPRSWHWLRPNSRWVSRAIPSFGKPYFWEAYSPQRPIFPIRSKFPQGLHSYKHCMTKRNTLEKVVTKTQTNNKILQVEATWDRRLIWWGEVGVGFKRLCKTLLNGIRSTLRLGFNKEHCFAFWKGSEFIYDMLQVLSSWTSSDAFHSDKLIQTATKI